MLKFSIWGDELTEEEKNKIEKLNTVTCNFIEYFKTKEAVKAIRISTKYKHDSVVLILFKDGKLWSNYVHDLKSHVSHVLNEHWIPFLKALYELNLINDELYLNCVQLAKKESKTRNEKYLNEEIKSLANKLGKQKLIQKIKHL